MKKRECIVCKSKFEVKKEDVYQVEDINGVSEILSGKTIFDAVVKMFCGKDLKKLKITIIKKMRKFFEKQLLTKMLKTM